MTCSRWANFAVDSRISCKTGCVKTERRDRAGRIAGMDARFFDVFHDPHDHDSPFRSAHRIDIDFGRIFEETIDQHRLPVGDDERLGDIPFELRLVVADLHRPTAEHKAGSHQCRESQSLWLRGGPRPCCGRSRWAAGAGPSSSINCWNNSRSSAASIVSTLVPMIGTPGLLQSAGKIQRRLTTELHDHAVGLNRIADVQTHLRSSAAQRTGCPTCRSRC